jgi:hypothetical protein
MLTTLSIARSIDSVEMYLRPDPSNLEKYFIDHLDADIPAEILKIDESPLQVLDMVYALDWEVRSLVHDYAHEAFAWACRFDNPGAVVPPLILSPTECHRITRAFWRLKLYGVLFYNYADRFSQDLSSTYSIFVDRLCPFEIDEMVTVYQSMVRNRHHFISSFPHDNCPFAGMLPYRNRDPFECPDCQGRYQFDLPRNQAFWHIMEDKYLGDRIMGADPAVCRKTPIKLWHDAEESNKPNAGYKGYPAFSNRGFGMRVSPLIARYFSYRNRGICFWDRNRLEGWDYWDRKLVCWICKSNPCDAL